MAEIPRIVDSDGTTYLHTEHGYTAAEIAEAMTEYVGRLVLASVPQQGGYAHRHWAKLRAVSGEVATLWVPSEDYEVKISVRDAFGGHCTQIEKLVPYRLCTACEWVRQNGDIDEMTGQLSRPACLGTTKDPCSGMK